MGTPHYDLVNIAFKFLAVVFCPLMSFVSEIEAAIKTQGE